MKLRNKSNISLKEPAPGWTFKENEYDVAKSIMLQGQCVKMDLLLFDGSARITFSFW